MSQQQESQDITSDCLIQSMYSIVPAGSWVLFTPHDGMIVSPNPQEIKSLIDVLTNQTKGNS